MWKMTATIDLSNPVFSWLLLNIPEDCCFKIGKTYYYNYLHDKDGAELKASTFSDALNDKEAHCQCFVQILQTNRILSFLYDVNIGVNINYHDYNGFVQVEKIDCGEIDGDNENLKRIKTFNELLESLDNESRKVFIRCVEFYARGLDLHYSNGLNEEAYLNVFKPIELISSAYIKNNLTKDKIQTIVSEQFEMIVSSLFGEEYDPDYHSEVRKELINKFDRLKGDLKRKVRICVRELQIDATLASKELDKLVKYRNEIVAHGNVDGADGDDLLDKLIKMIYLCRELMSVYFLELPYKGVCLEIDPIMTLNQYVRKTE